MVQTRLVAGPCLCSEWGFFLTFERPTGDIAFPCPSLAVGGVRAEAGGGAAHQLDPIRILTKSKTCRHTPVPAVLPPVEGEIEAGESRRSRGLGQAGS